MFAMSAYPKLFGLLVLRFLVLFSTVIIGHGNNGKDKVDEVEGAKKDDDDEEAHLVWTICFNHLDDAICIWQTLSKRYPNII